MKILKSNLSVKEHSFFEPVRASVLLFNWPIFLKEIDYMNSKNNPGDLSLRRVVYYVPQGYILCPLALGPGETFLHERI